MFNSLWPHEPQHTRLPCPSLCRIVCSHSCPLSRWCHPTISSLLPSSPALNLSQHYGLFQWVGSSYQVAKVLELWHSASNEYSGLISFRIDWFYLLAVQKILKSLLQHHILKASIFWLSTFSMVQIPFLELSSAIWTCLFCYSISYLPTI